MKGLFLTALIISFLPVWRYPPKEGGHNLWQLLGYRQEKRPHLPVKEAVAHARKGR